MIIDSHAHIGRVLFMNLSLKKLLYSMEKYGVDFSLVSNIECTEYYQRDKKLPFILRKSQTRALKRTLRAVKKHPDKLGILVWLRIGQELPDEKLIKLIEKNREYIYGIKLHPYRSQTAPDSPKLEPVYDLARRFDLTVVSHTGDSDEADSIRLYNAAKAHPDINFVAVHMDLESGNDRAIERISKLPNLYGDTTWVPVKSTLKAIDKCGSQKILFGTDNPIDGKDTLLYNRAGQRALSQEYFNEFKTMVSKDDYDKIMYKNAERLFNIKLSVN